MGLAVASVFGHDCVVFLDDDEVALDEDYLVARYGLDTLTPRTCASLPRRASISTMRTPHTRTCPSLERTLLVKADGFNDFMRARSSRRRASRASTVLCGGCCAIHAEAFTKVPFDPYVSRGEDLDYVLDLRAHGIDVWFDNEWFGRWQPPQEMAAHGRDLSAGRLSLAL